MIYRRKGGRAMPWSQLQSSPVLVWKGLCLHQGGTLEEMMLLCTSFGCYSADSSKHLALGGGAGPIELKVCP